MWIIFARYSPPLPQKLLQLEKEVDMWQMIMMYISLSYNWHSPSIPIDQRGGCCKLQTKEDGCTYLCSHKGGTSSYIPRDRWVTP